MGNKAPETTITAIIIHSISGHQLIPIHSATKATVTADTDK